MRLRDAGVQLVYLGHEVRLRVNRKVWRWGTVWFSGAIGPLARYRIERCLFLLLGRLYRPLRPLFLPFFVVLRLLGKPAEIHYRAQIGRGLRILHPSLGVVISRKAVCGENLVVAGGNCIGSRSRCRDFGQIRLGSNVTLGASAVVLGPVKIGDGCQVGAGAVVTRDAEGGSILVGAPASPLEWRRESK